MKNNNSIFLLVVGCILFSFCKTKEGISDNQRVESIEVIKIRKSPCFGTCPVFEMSIYNDLTVIYDGKKYTEKLGLYDKQISEDQYQSILNQFDEYDFWSLDSDYNSNVMDAPVTEISIRKDTLIKTVKSKLGEPKSFYQVEKVLTDLANSPGWKNLADQGVVSDPEDQIIFQLHAEVELDPWLTKYKTYEIQIIKRLSPKLDYWLASFNTQSVAKQDLLTLLRKDKDVINAEFNQKVHIR